MRVIAGKFRGKKIDIVGIDSTRETQDKIRGAILTLFIHIWIIKS